LTKAATRLSERLVVHLRRQLLLPTLHRLIQEEQGAKRRAASGGVSANPDRRARRVRRSARGHRR
jgi:hypothetical protein